MVKRKHQTVPLKSPEVVGRLTCYFRSKALTLTFAEGQKQLQADIKAYVERYAKTLLGKVAPKPRKRRRKK